MRPSLSPRLPPQTVPGNPLLTIGRYTRAPPLTFSRRPHRPPQTCSGQMGSRRKRGSGRDRGGRRNVGSRGDICSRGRSGRSGRRDRKIHTDKLEWRKPSYTAPAWRTYPSPTRHPACGRILSHILRRERARQRRTKSSVGIANSCGGHGTIRGGMGGGSICTREGWSLRAASRLIGADGPPLGGRQGLLAGGVHGKTVSSGAKGPHEALP